ncbi:DNA-3-methyladenine glycosylase family protein [Sphingomonas oryzagri]|uniref:DNA-3-methyladenine glycosylase II n=1 Tax=Sphingomonas oryzagri TaxID=3042314 RepID=A0ABT6N6Q3_9SPHN|nr:DNA-3-methyladenine glycosylase 2 family protein [Sphingomonas oryzagri]MDH7640773.1 DNA-3-methyladenine glycosylase 2 family protein [Sphingomonas oryzagri]
MGIPIDELHASLTTLAALEPAFARGIERVGLPDARISERGYATLLRTIVGQQVSVHAARAVWNRLEAALGDMNDPALLLAATDEELRACGLSRQKAGYARSLAGLVGSGELDLARLDADDEQAIADLVRIKGIGRWSAEIYLLFAEGRPDIWPAGDLAVQVEVGRLLGLEDRPSEKLTRELADAWRPHRGAAAIFAWHHYGAAGKSAAPV